MIARFVGPHCVRAFAQHNFEDAERQELPTRRGKVALEAELIDVVLGLDGEIFNCKYVSGVNYFTFHRNSSPHQTTAWLVQSFEHFCRLDAGCKRILVIQGCRLTQVLV